MRVSATQGSANPAQGNSSANAIERLQEKLHELVVKLKEVTTGDLDPQAKKELTELLQLQIKAVQAQIEALTRKQQQAQVEEMKESADSISSLEQMREENRNRKASESSTTAVDTYA
jgi:transposase